MIHTVKGFGIVNKAEVYVFFRNFFVFSMIQQILIIWSLVPLPVFNQACTSGRPQFIYCWSPAWRILSITLLTCEMNTIVLISHASKVTFKILQARLQQYMSGELPDVQAEFRKGRQTRAQIALLDHWEKHLLLLYWLCQSLWLCWSQQTAKFLKRWEYQTTWPACWEIGIQVKKQQLEPGMEQWTGSKLGKDYIKAVCCHHAYLTYMQSTLWETLDWVNYNLESRLLG